MENEKVCINPKCNSTPLKEIRLESSLTTRKLYCPNCGRPYNETTTIGKIAQVAPPIIAAGALVSLFDAVFAGDSAGDFARDSAGDFARDSAGDFASIFDIF